MSEKLIVRGAREHNLKNVSLELPRDRLIALNMALSGTPRAQADRYLAENFDLDDRERLLDDVYSRVG